MFVELCSRNRMTAYKIQCKMSVVFSLFQLKAFCVYQFYCMLLASNFIKIRSVIEGFFFMRFVHGRNEFEVCVKEG
jgi:hypothetical protein